MLQLQRDKKTRWQDGSRASVPAAQADETWVQLETHMADRGQHVLQPNSVCVHARAHTSIRHGSGSALTLLKPKWCLDKISLILISLEILIWAMWKSLERKGLKSCYFCLISWCAFLLMPYFWLLHGMRLRLEQPEVSWKDRTGKSAVTSDYKEGLWLGRVLMVQKWPEKDVTVKFVISGLLLLKLRVAASWGRGLP